MHVVHPLAAHGELATEGRVANHGQLCQLDRVCSLAAEFDRPRVFAVDLEQLEPELLDQQQQILGPSLRTPADVRDDLVFALVDLV